MSLALLVQFPLRINSDAGNYSLNDPAALQSRFQEVFSSAVRAAILNQKPATVFCNSQGAMYGNGVIWINLTSHGYAIQVVNLPMAPGQKPQAERQLKFVCQTEKYRIIIDAGDQTAPRYRAWNKPRPVTEKPDQEVAKGTETFEGTGACAYPIWTFQTGQTKYAVEGLGCFGDSTRPPEGAKGTLSVSVNEKVLTEQWCF